VLADLGSSHFAGKGGGRLVVPGAARHSVPYTAAVESRRRFADALLASGNTTAAIARYQELLEERRSPASKEQPDAGLLLALARPGIAGDTRNAKSVCSRCSPGNRRVKWRGSVDGSRMMYKNEETPRSASYFRQAGQASPAPHPAVNRRHAFRGGEYKTPAGSICLPRIPPTKPNTLLPHAHDRRQAAVNDLAGADKDIARSERLRRVETELAQFELERETASSERMITRGHSSRFESGIIV
jgi:hypothetical protein